MNPTDVLLSFYPLASSIHWAKLLDDSFNYPNWWMNPTDVLLSFYPLVSSIRWAKLLDDCF